MTPMQEQYYKLKKQYPDTVLLFRLGDFYEAFNDDAKLLSKVLGITLTGRGKDDNRTPMAGIPYHALPTYMPKMVDAGLKVAIADQMTDASPGKLVERQITKIITPGTVIDENSLDTSKNNYIASIYRLSIKNAPEQYALILCDLTTGELKAFSTQSFQTLNNEIKKFRPAEIIVTKEQKYIFEDMRLESVEGNEYKKSLEILLEQFGVKSLKGFGINSNDKPANLKEMIGNCIILAAANLIVYLKDCQRGELKHIKNIRLYSYEDYMQLDSETIRNLELLFSVNSDKMSTLYEVLNQCRTSMGQRKLRGWIISPLINSDLLSKRLNSVEIFYSDRVLSANVQEGLNQISDIERITGRIGIGSANPKDLVGLKLSVESALNIFEILPASFHYLYEKIDNQKLDKVIEIIKTSLDDDPSAMVSMGGVIRVGYNKEIDELRSLRRDAKQILAEMQKREIERTKISSLKISYNNVFGYYIEVTKSHIDKVPSDYIRKQTLSNGERFITEELKQLETKILSAEEKLLKLESELFNEIREQIAEYATQLLVLADSIAVIDILSNFGSISRECRFVKPTISKEKNRLHIKNGRHPVVEKLVGNFTPNNADLGADSFINIITGPNMSGKSTYIRQVALICLIAQVGCFVPADEMEFSVLDRIFTRVGASDNLSKGESTFMVEMSETANILNNASPRSLIILDEIGRGTSTYDGVAIAWSVVEYIQKNLKAKTLFATHYHELTAMADQYEGISNSNVKVIEEKDEILFTHKIIPGGADKSYGVYVAKIAGVPSEIVDRANSILNKFESQDSPVETKKIPKTPKKIHPEQLNLI